MFSLKKIWDHFNYFLLSLNEQASSIRKVNNGRCLTGMVFPKLKGTEIQYFNSHKQKNSVNIFILLSGGFHAVEN